MIIQFLATNMKSSIKGSGKQKSEEKRPPAEKQWRVKDERRKLGHIDVKMSVTKPTEAKTRSRRRTGQRPEEASSHLTPNSTNFEGGLGRYHSETVNGACRGPCDAAPPADSCHFEARGAAKIRPPKPKVTFTLLMSPVYHLHLSAPMSPKV